MQLYNSSKEDYQKRLNEFEKCHAVIMNQFEIIKGAHGKLEKNGKYVMHSGYNFIKYNLVMITKETASNFSKEILTFLSEKKFTNTFPKMYIFYLYIKMYI